MTTAGIIHPLAKPVSGCSDPAFVFPVLTSNDGALANWNQTFSPIRMIMNGKNAMDPIVRVTIGTCHPSALRIQSSKYPTGDPNWAKTATTTNGSKPVANSKIPATTPNRLRPRSIDTITCRIKSDIFSSEKLACLMLRFLIDWDRMLIS